MRYPMIAIGLAAVSATASAQSDGWQVYEAEGMPTQAFVVAEDGSQLILKCDKPGRRAVYAVVVTQESLVPPAASFTMRPVRVRFDDGGSDEARWRFYEHSVVAIDQGAERSLTRLLRDLSDASTMELIMDPGQRPPVQVDFTVAGAKEPIAQVFDSCKDKNPVG